MNTNFDRWVLSVRMPDKSVVQLDGVTPADWPHGPHYLLRHFLAVKELEVRTSGKATAHTWQWRWYRRELQHVRRIVEEMDLAERISDIYAPTVAQAVLLEGESHV